MYSVVFALLVVEYRISLNNNGAIILFSPPKRGIYLGQAIISNIAHSKAYPKYFVLISL